MIDQSVIAFTITALIITLTPGNDTILVFRNSLSGHRSAGFATMFGICAGLIVHGAFASMGISVILTQSATLFQVVKLAGAGYLIFLGGQTLWAAWKNRDKQLVTSQSESSQKPKSVAKSFGEGVLTNVLNPKVALFYLSFLPQFIAPTDPFFKPLLLAGIHIVWGIIWLSIVVLMINKMRKILTNPRAKSIMDAICGTVLVSLGVRLAVNE